MNQSIDWQLSRFSGYIPLKVWFWHILQTFSLTYMHFKILFL